jgi:homoserine kinase
VAGAFLAGLADGLDVDDAREGSFLVATRLEGHSDNAGASAHGGFVVTTPDHVVRLDVPPGLRALVWSPSSATSTDVSRRALPEQVSMATAAHSIAGAALWVAGVATGDLSVLRRACEDELHHPGRLRARPESTEVLEALLGSEGVLAAWLSGSGPTIAALLAPGADGEQLCAALGPAGRCRVLEIADAGVRTES